MMLGRENTFREVFLKPRKFEIKIFSLVEVVSESLVKFFVTTHGIVSVSNIKVCGDVLCMPVFLKFVFTLWSVSANE